MTYKGHLIFSIAIIIFIKKINFFNCLNSSNWGHIIFGTIFACLLPDIDHPKSWLGNKLKFLSYPMTKLFGHRGITHSLFAIIIFIFLLKQKIFLSFLPEDIIFSMIISYISHILADIFTPFGVPLLWPLLWRFKIPIIYSHKNIYQEKFFCILLLVIAIMYPIKISFFNFIYLENIFKYIFQYFKF